MSSSSTNGAPVLTLADFYQSKYRPPRVTNVSPNTLAQDDTAVRYFANFYGAQDVPLAEIDEAAVDRFQAYGQAARSKVYRRKLADCIRRICRAHAPERFPFSRPYYQFADAADALFPASGTVPDASGDWTLESVFNRLYLVECLGGRDPKTVVCYHESLRHWHAAVGELAVKDVKRSHLFTFRQYLQEQPGRYGAKMRDATRSGHEKRIMRLLQYAEHVDLIEKAPWMKPTRIVNTLKKIELGPAETEKLLAACDRKRTPRLPGIKPGDVWRVFIITAAHTGLRVSELTALRWEWISKDVLRVPREVMKGKYEHRVIALHPQLRVALEAIKHPWPFVFQGIHALDCGCMTQHLRRLARWAGVDLPPGNAWHSFRRALVNDVCRRANDPHVAQLVIGHGDLSTTANHYLQALTKEDASLVQQRKVVFARPAIGTTPVQEQVDEMREDVEKAEEYLARGELKEAGWRARCGLERLLKRACRRHNLRVGRRPRLIGMALALAAEGVLERETVKKLHRIIPLVHKSSHGKLVRHDRLQKAIDEVRKICLPEEKPDAGDNTPDAQAADDKQRIEKAHEAFNRGEIVIETNGAA